MAAVVILYHPARSNAQGPAFRFGAPPPPAGSQPAGGNLVRFAFLNVDQYSYSIHPYYQITGDGAYANGRGVTGSSFNLSEPPSDVNADFLTKLLHMIPPVGVEWTTGTEFFLPKTVSIGLENYRFSQKDVSAASGSGPLTVLPIVTDTYFYSVVARAYAFDATQPGLNYFVGIGLGILNGNLYADPYVGQTPQVISYGQSPVGNTRFGLDAKGQNMGFRYELIIVNASQVKLDSNPYPTADPAIPAPTKIDFSGSIMRIAIFYDFK